MENVNERKLFEIFYPYAFGKYQNALNNEQRFIHYTSAETAMKIIQNKEVWMRDTTCMNDFAEIEYGLYCLSKAFHSGTGEKFIKELNKLFSGLGDQISILFKDLSIFSNWSRGLKFQTYLTSLSEHDNDEEFGRLSMWRAYGQNSGVALVFNKNILSATANALITSPVAYFNEADVENQLNDITNNIVQNSAFLKMCNEYTIIEHVFDVFKYGALCIKHPGFKEEKEWRIIYSETMKIPSFLKADTQSLNGIPQRIYKIPLEDKPEKDFIGTSIPKLIDHIIIGPTQYPLAVSKAFTNLLAEAGVLEPQNRINISRIPLRT